MQEFQYDVFISYSHNDTGWVERILLPRLQKERIRYRYDRDFEEGRFAVTNIREGIEQSKKTILLLSPSWVKSNWTNFEGGLIQTLDLLGMQGRIIPVMIEACQPPLDIAARSYIDMRPEHGDRIEFEAQMERLIGSIRRPVQLRPPVAVARVQPLPVYEKPAPLPPLSVELPAWVGGAKIDLKGDIYELLTGKEQAIEKYEAEDKGSMIQQARARLLDGNRQYPLVWLKQVVKLHEARSARDNFQALRIEYGMLERFSHLVYPRSAAFYEQDDTLTLAYKYPLNETTAKPAKTLAQHYGLADSPLDAYYIKPFLRSLLPVCQTLTLLHNLRPERAHRLLSPTSIFVVARRSRPDMMVLRDLGLAAFPAHLKEGPEEYRAPEQINWGGKVQLPGSKTDVYQLAAIIYRLFTGLPVPSHLSSPKNILNPSIINDKIPTVLDEILLRALSLDEGDRPSMSKFARDLKYVVNQKQ